MNIPQHIKETMASLSKVNLDFLDFVNQNPACLRQENFREMDAIRTRLYFFQSWPVFIGKETRNLFHDAGVNVLNLIKSIPERIFQNDLYKMSAYYELPKSLVEIQMEGMTTQGLEHLLARGDFLYSSTGLKCVEFNIASSLGGYLIPLWEAEFVKNPLIQQFLKEYHITLHHQNLLEECLSHLMKIAAPLVSRSGHQEMNIGTIVPHYGPGLPPRTQISEYLSAKFQELLKRDYPSYTGNFFRCNYPDLEIINDHAYFQKKEVHVAIEWHLGVVPPRVMKAFNAGNFIILNGPITNLVSAKSNLAILSEHADRHSDLFTHQEREIIHQYIPWTRKIETGLTSFHNQSIRLEEFILENKDLLIIKPSLGAGGESVLIGKSTSPSEWNNKIKTILPLKNWVVQEMLQSKSILCQYGDDSTAYFDMIWGLYVFGNQYAGTGLRALLSHDSPRVVNAHQGAQTIMVLNAVD